MSECTLKHIVVCRTVGVKYTTYHDTDKEGTVYFLCDQSQCDSYDRRYQRPEGTVEDRFGSFFCRKCKEGTTCRYE